MSANDMIMDRGYKSETHEVYVISFKLQDQRWIPSLPGQNF